MDDTNEQKKEKERYEIAFNLLETGLWDWNAASDSIYGSYQFFSILGYNRPQKTFTIENFLSRVHPEHKSKVELTLKKSLEENKRFDFSFRLPPKNEKEIWVQAKGRPVKGEEDRIVGILTDVTEEKLAEIALMESEATLENLLMITSDETLALNEKIQALLKMCQINLKMENAACGKMREEKIKIIQRISLYETLQSSVEGSLAQNSIKEIIRAGHSVHFIDSEDKNTRSFIGVPIFAEEKIFGAVWFSSRNKRDRDFTNRDFSLVQIIAQWIGISLVNSNAQRTLEIEKEKADSANRAKTEFLETMSHEIRTPLNGIIGTANILLDTPLNDKQTSFVMTLLKSSDSLLALVNEIFDYTRAETGQIDLEIHPFNVANLMDDIVRQAKPDAEKKGLDLNCRIDSETPEHVIGDSVRIRQIIDSLIKNALKFTHKGSIRIEVEPVRIEGSEFELKFSVEDTGIGIPESMMPSIFEKFNQADSSTTRKYGGIGLGLAMCKEMTKVLGGSIDVESTPGLGSKFWFTVPLKIDRNQFISPYTLRPLEETAPAEQDPVSAKHCHVMIVDDNPMNVDLLSNMLKSFGCRVTPAGDGTEAVNLAKAADYDLIFMDCRMPQMDGYTATQLIRFDQKARGVFKTPIIALTAYLFNNNKEKSLAEGMDDYISKPFIKEDIINILYKWVPQKITQNDETILKQLKSHFGGQFNQIMNAYFDMSRELLESLEKGIDNENAPLISSSARTLHSYSIQINQMYIAKLAEKIDSMSENSKHETMMKDLRSLKTAIEKLQKCYENIGIAG
jgi:PAS domain S-box-containing protein